MNIAVLCPGPTLEAQYSGMSGKHDYAIAVNLAVQTGWADAWCCFDWQSFKRFKAPNDIPIICRKDTWQIGKESGAIIENPIAMMVDPAAEDTPPDVDERYTWTSCGAVIAAYMMGAKRITMYGADMAGNAGYKGIKSGNRNEIRWAREMKSLESLNKYLSEQGTIVERII